MDRLDLNPANTLRSLSRVSVHPKARLSICPGSMDTCLFIAEYRRHPSLLFVRAWGHHTITAPYPDEGNARSFLTAGYTAKSPRSSMSMQTSHAIGKAVESCLVSSVSCPGACGLSSRLAHLLAPTITHLPASRYCPPSTITAPPYKAPPRRRYTASSPTTSLRIFYGPSPSSKHHLSLPLQQLLPPRFDALRTSPIHPPPPQPTALKSIIGPLPG